MGTKEPLGSNGTQEGGRPNMFCATASRGHSTDDDDGNSVDEGDEIVDDDEAVEDGDTALRSLSLLSSSFSSSLSIFCLPHR